MRWRAAHSCPPGKRPSCSAQFALSLALKDVHLAIEAADDDRFAALACLADEWQQVVDQGLGAEDLTVVAQALEQPMR
jgi:3-hydroxyisobutyrate dehydrogenase